MVLDDLRKIYSVLVEDEKINLQALENNKNNPIWTLNSVVVNNTELAIHSIFVDKNFGMARKYLYTGGVAIGYLHANCKQSIYSSPKNLCYSVLSDSSKLIDRFLELEDGTLQDLSAYFGRSIKAIIKNDHSVLEELIQLISKEITKNSWEKYFRGIPVALNGILQKDITIIESGLQTFLETYKKLENIPALRNFFSLEATTITKLSLQRGLNVNLNNSLVPEEMLTTKELTRYDTYRFFNDFI